jgi:hypothetical protein
MRINPNYSTLHALMEATEPCFRSAVLIDLFPHICKRSRRYQQRWASAYLVRGHYPMNFRSYPELRETLVTIASAIDDRVMHLEDTIGVPKRFLRLWERKQGFRLLIARRWLVEGVGCIDTLIHDGTIPPAPHNATAPGWESDFCKHFGLRKAPRSYMSEALGQMTVTTRVRLAGALSEARLLLGVE